MAKRIGIYGIAANPPTLGHTHVIKSVLESNIVDEIWVLPVFKHFHSKEMVSYDIRVEMCEHAFMSEHAFSDDRVKVKKFEGAIAELEPEYDGSTTSMLRNLRKHIDEDFHIIIGQDNADTMETWHNGEELINNEQFIIIPRPKSLSDKVKDTGGFVYGELNLIVAKSKWYNRPPHNFLSDIEPLDISSTMVRDICTRSRSRMTLLKNDSNRNQIDSVLEDIVQYDILNYKLYTTGKFNSPLAKRVYG